MAKELLAPLRERPTRSALFFDVDGTLAPIVQRPEAASVPQPTRALLSTLNGRYGLVVCVSGRRAADAKRVVGVDELAYVGNHGFEYLPPGSQEPRTVSEASSQAGALRSFALAAHTPVLQAAGVRIEDKREIWSFHWREAPDEGSAREALERIAEWAAGAGFAPHWGRKVLEIRPAVAANKGTAIRELLDRARADTGQFEAALYGGDDRTDLDAFRSLRELESRGSVRRAVCVGVRSDEGPAEITAEADLVVDGTDGFAELLEQL